ncbi:MAG: PD-(D/E)XK nuclease family protein [Caldisericaceae bacterium]
MELSGFQKEYLSLSVSDIVTIFKCPMQVYLKKKGVNAHFRYSFKYNIGTLVHEVLSQFVSEVRAPNLFGVNVDFGNEDELYKFIEKSLYTALISKMEQKSYSKSYFDIAWEHLKVMANYFANLITNNNSSFSEIFLFAEEPFSFNIDESIIIQGRFDLLISDNDQLKIIDYKTKKEDFENDIVQVSLYAKGMEIKTGKSIEPMLLYTSRDGLREIRFTKDEVDLTYRQIEKELADFKKMIEGKKEPHKTYDRSLCRRCSAASLPICKQDLED